MQARSLLAGAVATAFLMVTVVPERVHASPADGIIGLAAGMILGGALAQSQPQPRYYRTYRQRRPVMQRKIVRQPSAAQQVRQQLKKPKQRVASDPFMDE
jgi:hypothetical protein